MLWIQDNFFKDPEKIRTLALKMNFRTDHKFFPGARSDKNYRSSEAQQQFRKIQGKSLKFVKGYFQFLGTQHRKSYIHIDSDFLWSGIVFLNDTKSFYPGTSFYQHKKTRIDHIEKDPKWIFNNLIDGEVSRLNRERFDFKKWDLVMTVPAKYNRLILFRADYYHMNASRWGSTPKNGRLTYNFYLL